jgi:hypothetical protein
VVTPNGEKTYRQTEWIKTETKKIVTAQSTPKHIEPECFEKGTSKRVSCGDDYIREKAAFAASNR